MKVSPTWTLLEKKGKLKTEPSKKKFQTEVTTVKKKTAILFRTERLL